MVDDVVLLQGLLDQQEVEAVQLGEGVGVRERVGGVRVDLQGNRPRA